MGSANEVGGGDAPPQEHPEGPPNRDTEYWHQAPQPAIILAYRGNGQGSFALAVAGERTDRCSRQPAIESSIRGVGFNRDPSGE
jgi:hypothetical protein